MTPYTNYRWSTSVQVRLPKDHTPENLGKKPTTTASERLFQSRTRTPAWKKEQRRWSHEDRLTSKTNRCWMRQINIFTKSEVQVAAYQLLSAAVYDMLTASPWPFTLKPKVISASYTWHGQSCFVLDSEADSAHSEGRRTDRRPPAIRNVASSKEGCIKVKEHIVLSEIHLRTTGRHLSMGSHSIICHPTEVPSPQPGRLVLDLSTP